MNKRLLTLDDLYSYYSSKKKSCHFSSKDDNDKITVQVGGNLKFEQDDDTENLLKVRLMACHTGINRNQSNISEEVMTKALPSFSNRPILGYIYYNENTNQDEFKGHEMHMDDNGELVYDEKPIGIIPESCGAHFEEIDGKQYVVVDGYIFDTYSKAGEILRREKECFVSIEISVRELSYNAKEKVLNIENMLYEGVTVLGRHESGDIVEPGMENANIKISDFKKNNSLFSDEEKLKSIVSEVIEKYSNTLMPLEHKNISGKEEKGMPNTETFEEEVVVTEETAVEEETTETEETFEEEVNDSENPEETFEEEVSEVEVEETETEEEIKPEELDFSVTLGETKVEFKLGLQEELMAMQELVNATYADTDNDYYSVNIFPETSTVEMYGLWSGRGYRQSYKKKKGCHSLVGDRTPIYAQWLTEDEMNQLENMKSNYSEMEFKLSNYEAEPQKMEVLNSKEYSSIADSEEFKALTSQDAHFEMSVEELTAKCDEILLNAAKTGKFEFAKEESHQVAIKPLMTAGELGKAGRYGSMFNRK